jgi:nucleotide-binding universal stress UspA family protein
MKARLVGVRDLIKKILVPFDGSDKSKHALEYAVNLAVQTSSQIQLLTVIPPVFLPTYSFYVLKSNAIRDCQKELEISFKGVLTKALSYIHKKNIGLKVSTKFAKGVPYKEIVKTAKEGDFDLIIMGTRGLEGQISYLGSVSSKVINEAPCPVLVIKHKYVRSALRKTPLRKQVKK